MGKAVKLAVTLSALLLAGCAAQTPPAMSTSLPEGARYVAMGSSFASGPGLGQEKPGTPPRCTRSALNYATLLAARLHLQLDDQTCGGATTGHVLGPWNELPPQIAAVTPDTALVTVTIGGNDLSYIINLMASSCRKGEMMNIPGRQIPCFAPRYPVEADYARVEASLTQIARSVRERAPGAKLVFVQYVTLVPEQPCAVVPITPEGIPPVRAIGERLAAITAKVAVENGAMVLPADSLSRTHTPCDAQPWSNGFGPTMQGVMWHPNAAGMAAIADALAGRLGGG